MRIIGEIIFPTRSEEEKSIQRRVVCVWCVCVKGRATKLRQTTEECEQESLRNTQCEKTEVVEQRTLAGFVTRKASNSGPQKPEYDFRQKTPYFRKQLSIFSKDIFMLQRNTFYNTHEQKFKHSTSLSAHLKELGISFTTACRR